MLDIMDGLVVLLALIGIPIFIYYFAKNETIAQNENYAQLRQLLRTRQTELVWEAFDKTGIVPLPADFAGFSGVSLFFDRANSKVFAFNFENQIIGKPSRIPKTYEKLLELFNSSKEKAVGWSLCTASEGEEFLEKLANLDDTLDFTISEEELELTNKIAFELRLITVNDSTSEFERVIKLGDGSIEVLDDTPSSVGTLSAVIELTKFKGAYSVPCQIEIANRNLVFD